MNTKWAKLIRTAYTSGVTAADVFGNTDGGVTKARNLFLQSLKVSRKNQEKFLHVWEQGLIKGKQERFGWLSLPEIVQLVQQETLNEANIKGTVTAFHQERVFV